MRKVNYKEKGITLIALVVTIIILLILAGVTLGTALSQNGLFQRAKIAGENYKRAEADETDKLGEVEKEIDKIVNGETSSSGIGSSDIAGNLKEYQGKYVDIGLDTNGDGQVNDWEIFYATNDRIFLIAADNVPTDKLSEWGVKESDTFESVDETLLDTLMFGEYDLMMHQEDENSKATLQMLDTDAWEGIKKNAREKDKIDFVVGGPTLGMWCRAWNVAVNGNPLFISVIENKGKPFGYDLDENRVNILLNSDGGDDKGLLGFNGLLEMFFGCNFSGSDEVGGPLLLATPASKASESMFWAFYGSLGVMPFKSLSGDGFRRSPCYLSKQRSSPYG